MLKKHKIFQKSDNKLQPKTNLLDEYLNFTKESENKNVLAYSLINNKLFQLYLEILEQYEPDFKQWTLYKQKIKNCNDYDENSDFNDLVDNCLRNLKFVVYVCEKFVEKVPGLIEMSKDYLKLIIKKNSVDFFIISHLNLYEDGILHIYSDKGYLISKKLFSKLRGTFKIDLMYDAFDKIDRLKLTEREKSVYLAYTFTMAGIHFEF